jgi:hypothetical protein
MEVLLMKIFITLLTLGGIIIVAAMLFTLISTLVYYFFKAFNKDYMINGTYAIIVTLLFALIIIIAAMFLYVKISGALVN